MRCLLGLILASTLHARPQSTFAPDLSSTSSLQAGQEQFTERLLRQIESSTDTNFVLSPHSLHSIFSQLLQGSGGRTQEELEAILGVAASDNLVGQYRTLASGLAGDNFKQANLLAVAEGFKPKTEYRNNLKSGFQSDIREFNFGSNSAGSVQEINQFVENATNQKIRDLLADGDVDSLTKMVLINAVYFKANWKFAFNPEETFTSSFRGTNGSIPNVDYLSRDATVRVLRDESRQLDILELPYDDPTKSMLIVLPKESAGSDDMAGRLSGLDLSTVRTEGRLANTGIFVPKFKLKFKTYLEQQMQQMGVRDLFSQAANLTGISDEELEVSSAVHQAFIEVNEEGTEAAAATAAVVGVRTAHQPKPQFFANRPFLFMVYDFQHNVTLFAGKVVDPSTDTVIQTRAALVADVLPTGTTNSQPSTTGAQFPTTVMAPQVTTAVRGDLKVCTRMFRDFPNSLDNSVICSRVESEGKKLNWLRSNRALCEESKDFFDNFTSKSCGPLWCEDASSKIAGWRVEADSTAVGGCKGVEDRVETPETKKKCKTIKNKLKAAEFLQCSL